MAFPERMVADINSTRFPGDQSTPVDSISCFEPKVLNYIAIRREEEIEYQPGLDVNLYLGGDIGKPESGPEMKSLIWGFHKVSGKIDGCVFGIPRELGIRTRRSSLSSQGQLLPHCVDGLPVKLMGSHKLAPLMQARYYRHRIRGTLQLLSTDIYFRSLQLQVV
ncbi:hypothetical protein C8R44DRAFT_746751 [Mycena epipterygia]|nr:hypothetical protein C8R44DRAFT_746751 [Mycena epipterygia]